jgi:hypothetical protein
VRANSERFREAQQAAWTRVLFEDLAAIASSSVARHGPEKSQAAQHRPAGNLH